MVSLRIVGIFFVAFARLVFLLIESHSIEELTSIAYGRCRTIMVSHILHLRHTIQTNPMKNIPDMMGCSFLGFLCKNGVAFCPVISCLSVDVALVGLSRIEGTRILSQLIQFHKNILDVMGWSSSVMIQSHEKYSRCDGVSLASYETSSRHSAHEKYLSHGLVCS